ncbi:carbohydrate esterase family 4 protein [Phlegmacium glaucopus]|nr:carbohydrate esterase family 4 protein [Phlegmacium glaucopus]
MQRSPTFSTIFALGVLALSGTHAQTPQPTQVGDSAVKDPDTGCTPYKYAPVADALGSFPTIWQPASILPDDNNAQAKWDSIRAGIPDISPKGTGAGDFSGLEYSSSDPDCWWTYSKCNLPKHSGIPVDISSVPEPHTLGYGFDDGPNCSHNAFYDYLSKQNQKATMFFIGSNVMNWPLEAQRAVTDGHEICVHSWSHRYMTSFQNEDAFAELYYSAYFSSIPICYSHATNSSLPPGMQAVKLVSGVTPTCWRPPFGDVDDRIRAIADGLGLRTILWDYDTNDWQVGETSGVTPESVDAMYQVLIDDAGKGLFDRTGAMVLAHELNDFTMKEAMKFYPRLKAAFKYIVPVAVSQNITNPYPETNYTMPTFSQYITGTTTTLARNMTGSSSSTTQATRPSDSSNVATGGGNNNNLGTNRPTSNALALDLNLVNFGGVVKVFGAFLLAGTGVMGIGFLG